MATPVRDGYCYRKYCQDIQIAMIWFRSMKHKAKTRTLPKGSRKKVLYGTVTKAGGNKTCRVEVLRRFRHPTYGKVVESKTVCYTHDEFNECDIGDKVVIIESRPRSKTKRWELLGVDETHSSSGRLVAPSTGQENVSGTDNKSTFTDDSNRVITQKEGSPSHPSTSPMLNQLTKQLEEFRMEPDANCLCFLLLDDDSPVAELRFWKSDFTVTTRWKTEKMAPSQLRAFSKSLRIPFPWNFVLKFSDLGVDSNILKKQLSVFLNFPYRTLSETPLIIEVLDKKGRFLIPDGNSKWPSSPSNIRLESKECDVNLLIDESYTPIVSCKFFPLSNPQKIISHLFDYFPVCGFSRSDVEKKIEAWCDEAAIECRKELDRVFKLGNT